MLHHCSVPSHLTASHCFWTLQVWNGCLMLQDEASGVVHFDLGQRAGLDVWDQDVPTAVCVHTPGHVEGVFDCQHVVSPGSENLHSFISCIRHHHVTTGSHRHIHWITDLPTATSSLSETVQLLALWAEYHHPLLSIMHHHYRPRGPQNSYASGVDESPPSAKNCTEVQSCGCQTCSQAKASLGPVWRSRGCGTPMEQQLLQVTKNLAVGGAVNAAQLPTERALQLPQERVGQGRDAFQTEYMATGKVLWSALPLLSAELLEADFTLQQVDLDLSQNPNRTLRGARTLGHDRDILTFFETYWGCSVSRRRPQEFQETSKKRKTSDQKRDDRENGEEHMKAEHCNIFVNTLMSCALGPTCHVTFFLTIEALCCPRLEINVHTQAGEVPWLCPLSCFKKRQPK